MLKALIEELSKCADMHNKNPIDSKRGRYGGTFVCKQLVIRYAMWINAAFELKVINFFSTGQAQGVAVAEHAAVDLKSGDSPPSLNT